MIRFLEDIMMKKAGRWLRMLGYDVEPGESEDDDALLAQAQRDGLTLLTKDRELHQRALTAGVGSFLPTKNGKIKEVAEILAHFGLNADNFPSRTRCPECNGPLREAGRKEVEAKVPAKSLEHYSQFWLCTKCGQVFWEGSHWEKIEKEVEKIRAELAKIEK
ncbi:MAG: Mut7-C RNAse domain-containing protein [Candidatus Burarchaeum sp.]|nr:Mut7-C RNAse domain-containing protein [Candidatus Burarchaeum sp.]MDO8339709.1 Mut7-C RNAse domain-containing protein [Candidatus Burarchaeum sp.]